MCVRESACSHGMREEATKGGLPQALHPSDGFSSREQQSTLAQDKWLSEQPKAALPLKDRGLGPQSWGEGKGSPLARARERLGLAVRPEAWT